MECLPASEKVRAERARTIERVLQQRAEYAAANPQRADLDEPVPARALAQACGCCGAAESNRRRIREAVELGREKLGMQICAGGDGYWLPRDHEEWRLYEDARRRGAKFEFVKAARRAAAVTDRCNEQGRLFKVWG